MNLLDVIAGKVLSFHQEILTPYRNRMAWRDLFDSFGDPQRLKERKQLETIGIPLAFLLWCIPMKKKKKGGK